MTLLSAHPRAKARHQKPTGRSRGGNRMTKKWSIVVLTLVIAFSLAACSRQQKAGKLDKDQVETALNKAGYGDVRADVDNEKGVVTLKGDTKTQEDKQKIDEVARTVAGSYVVANEVAIRPEGAESRAKKVESNLDDSIKSDWKALSASMKWDDQHINADVNNGVLRLKGDVDTPQMRADVEKAAAKLPNVQQVVNELEVKSAKGNKKAANKTAGND